MTGTITAIRLKILRTRLIGSIALVGVLASVTVSTARAQGAYRCIEELSDEEVTYRLSSIQKTFADGKNKALGWRIGWATGSLAMSAGTLANAVLATREGKAWDRFGFAFLSAGGAVVALRMLLTPMPELWGPKRIGRMPDDTLAQRRAKLRYATRKLEQGAKVESLNGGPGGVMGGVLLALVGGSTKIAKWRGKTPTTTTLMFVAPPVLATLAAVSAPTHMREGWERYRGIACSSRYYDRGPDTEFELSVGPGGVSLGVTF